MKRLQTDSPVFSPLAALPHPEVSQLTSRTVSAESQHGQASCSGAEQAHSLDVSQQAVSGDGPEADSLDDASSAVEE